MFFSNLIKIFVHILAIFAFDITEILKMKLTAQYVICLQHMCNTLASLGKLKKPCPTVHERVMEKRQALNFLPVLGELINLM